MVVIIPIHSFIHFQDLYSASSRLLLRSAPDPCTAKKNSFEARVECVTNNPGDQSIHLAVPKEAHSTQEGPTTENARAWLVEVRANNYLIVVIRGVPGVYFLLITEY